MWRAVRPRFWALVGLAALLTLAYAVPVLLLVLLLIGLTRARPGRDVPFYDPTVTTSTTPSALPQAPAVTAGAEVTTAVPPPKGATATTRRHR